ncbi:MFS drug transporter [Blastomyces dermatitidis ER-3]|uniref:MFS drug transporter n=1 Tax=Ajellomyces dermatitidis (strain ER-3 / ATCC MYA-2586) TaxID=559297 RepID=A0ABP2EVZ8_AJEDR|nr:MFS drug transporter [Blastomyces dermatitidis ER-3]EEQ88181.2 MFS drug transporter [Blastomyces dermatitidis ER-3]
MPVSPSLKCARERMLTDQARHPDAENATTQPNDLHDITSMGSVPSPASARDPTETSQNIEASAGSSSDPPTSGERSGGNGEKEAKMSKSRIAVIMTALCLAVFLAALDMTIITTALPTISEQFKVSQGDYTWIGSAYTLGAAASMPSWGKISDIFGRKPILLLANVVFFVGSLICGLSINIKMLLAGRAVQGIGGGGLLSLVNISIGDLFSMRTRSVYYAMVGMVWAIAGTLGPVIGGAFTQYVSWRWCFYVNLPIDGVAFVIILFFLKIQTPKTPFLAGLRAIDWFGSITVVCGTVMFLLGLDYGGVSFPWTSATVICLIVFGVVTLGIFVIIQWKVAAYPIIPLWLFKQRSTVAAYGAALFHGFVFTSDSFFLPLYFQVIIGASPLQSGIYLFPSVISMALASASTGIFIRKTGQYLPVIWLGFTVMLLGHGLYIDLPSQTSWPRIIIYQIISGLGIGPNFQAPLIALQSHIKPGDIATATSTFGFCRNIASSVSVVISGVIFQNHMKSRLDKLSGQLPPQVIQQLGATSAGASAGIVNSLPEDQKRPILEAYTNALQMMWVFYTVLSAGGLAVSLLIGRQTLRKEHEVTKTGLDVQARERDERLQREKDKKLEKEEKKRMDNATGISIQK